MSRMSYADAYRRKRSSSRHNNSSANDTSIGRDGRSFGGISAGSTVQSMTGERKSGGYSSVHNKTNPDNTMLAKEREIEEKHRAIMRENKLRLKKQQETAELAKMQKEEQERQALEQKKRDQKQLYNQYFKPYNNNKEKIERSLSRGRQSSQQNRKSEPLAPNTKPGLPPPLPHSSSKQQIQTAQLHYKPPLPQQPRLPPTQEYGVNVMKNQWLDKHAGDMKDLLGLDMSGTFEQMEQLVNEEYEHQQQTKPAEQQQILHEDRILDQPSLDLTSLRNENLPEPRDAPQQTSEPAQKRDSREPGARIFDCDVSVIPNK